MPSTRPGVISLKDQLALLQDPAPIDFDPEALDDGFPDEESDNGGVGSGADGDVDDGKLAREHYVAVGKSKLRKPGPVLLDPKYDGARVSRKKLFEDESDEDDREEEEKSERDSLSGSGDEEGGIRFEDMDEMDIVTGAGESDEEIDSDMAFGESDVEKERFSSYKFSGSSTTKNGIVPKKGHKVTVDSDEEEEESEGDDDGGSEEESEDERRPSRKPANGKVEDEDSDEYDDGEDEDDADGDESDDDEEREAVHRAKLRKMVAEEQKNVMAKITKDVKADAEKGAAVRQQQATFDNLLGGRIKLQKAIIGANGISLQSSPQPQNSESIKAAEEAALKLWNLITDMRTDISEARKPLSTSTQNGHTTNGTKRKHSDLSQDTPLTTFWSTMTTLESQSHPIRMSTLQKWSSKVNSSTSTTSIIPASRRLNSAAHKNQQNNITNLLNDILTNDSERLIKKTRIARSCVPPSFTSTATRKPTPITSSTIATPTTGPPEHPNIYDDTDFYQLLLKTLVSQRMVDSSNPTLGGTTSSAPIARWTTAMRESRVKKIVDTKASKGRKLRYHVHDKLQNFMAPVPVLRWERRRVDELFGSLLGMRTRIGEEEEEEDSEDEKERIEMPDDGLRVFG